MGKVMFGNFFENMKGSTKAVLVVAGLSFGCLALESIVENGASTNFGFGRTFFSLNSKGTNSRLTDALDYGYDDEDD